MALGTYITTEPCLALEFRAGRPSRSLEEVKKPNTPKRPLRKARTEINK